MNTFSSLNPISRNPDKLVATGIAKTVTQLGHAAPELKNRILHLLTAPQAPLTEAELDAIEDAITSVPGWDLMALANHRLFYEFDLDKKLRERDFVSLVGSALAEFETGWMHKHRELMGTSDFVASFAREEKKKEPAQITGSDIWTHIKNQQSLAIKAENKRLFLEACQNWKTNMLNEWTREWGTVQLRYDATNNLMGALDSEEGILGDTVLAGHQPIPHVEMFYGDEWTVPCTSDKNQRELCLVEFNPRGMQLFGWPCWHFNIIESKYIHQRGIIKALDGTEILYCVVKSFDGNERVIHAWPGRTVVSNQPLQEFTIDGDKIFIAHESSGSCAHYVVHSLQTGWYTRIPLNNIKEDTKTDDDRVFTLRVRDAFEWMLHSSGRENTKWKLGNEVFGKWSVSIRELAWLWHKTAKKAKERK